jgi:hypothetical protein
VKTVEEKAVTARTQGLLWSPNAARMIAEPRLA